MKKILILMALISLFMVGVVNAAAPSLSLDTTTWQSGTNISIALTDGNNVTYVTVYASSSSTANSSTSLIANITNTTGMDFMGTKANFTLGSDILLEDSNDYSITATTTGNGLADGVTLSATTVTVDRTAPTAPVPASGVGVVFDDVTSKTISYTVTGTDTTSCRISFASSGGTPRFSGTNTFSMTHSANTCTYTVTKATIPDGIYDVYSRASDGTNTTVSVKRDYGINTFADDVGAIGGVEAQAIGEAVAARKIGGNAIFVIILIALVWFMFFRPKGKGKR